RRDGRRRAARKGEGEEEGQESPIGSREPPREAAHGVSALRRMSSLANDSVHQQLDLSQEFPQRYEWWFDQSTGMMGGLPTCVPGDYEWMFGAPSSWARFFIHVDEDGRPRVTLFEDSWGFRQAPGPGYADAYLAHLARERQRYQLEVQLWDG